MANCPKSVVDNTDKKDALTNLCGIIEAKKNAANLAGFNGVKDHKKRDISCKQPSPKRKRSAMSLYGEDAHKRVAKSIGYALTLGTSTAWNGVLIILASRLTENERVSLAWAALSTCTDDHAYKIASSILYSPKATPLVGEWVNPDKARPFLRLS